jgi:sigma-E factor negative regulatory protein RseA
MEELARHQEAISALADGELSADEFDQTMARLGGSQEDRLTWLAYHVTRDVMRAGPSLAGGVETVFMQRLKQSLAQQPPRASVLPDVEIIATGAEPISVRGRNDLKNEAANDGYFRWKWMAGLASVVMVSLVGWQAVGSLSSSPAGAQLAQGAALVSPAVLASVPTTAPMTEAPVMLRDPQLDALLAAHRQFGGASALQMPTGFLRNATFDGADR